MNKNPKRPPPYRGSLGDHMPVRPEEPEPFGVRLREKWFLYALLGVGIPLALTAAVTVIWVYGGAGALAVFFALLWPLAMAARASGVGSLWR